MLYPFSATRPTRDKAYLVATRSYISYSPEHLHDKLAHNPYTFLHVINPEAEKDEEYKVKFAHVRDRYNLFNEEGIFLHDKEPGYYLYMQQTPTHRYMGIIGLLGSSEIEAGRLKTHEDTIAERESIFTTYLETVGFQAEPLLVFAHMSGKLRTVVEEMAKGRPEYEFTSTDRVLHHLWRVTDAEVIQEMQEELSGVENYYVADGHHRLASSMNVAMNHPENPLAQGIMSLCLFEEDVNLQAFERWVNIKDAVNIEALKALLVDPLEEMPAVTPKGETHIYFEGQWYRHPLHCDHTVNTEVLQREILRPFIGIEDARNDTRLSYIYQTEENNSTMMEEKGYSLGFRLPNIWVEELIELADSHGTMPPKSTYIEPKLRSGLLIHEFK